VTDKGRSVRGPGENLDNAVSEGRSVSGTIFVLLTVVLLASLTVANALILNALAGRFRPLCLVLLLSLESVVTVVAIVLRPQLLPALRWRGLEIAGALVVGGVFLAHAAHLSPRSWMPVSFSVDCSHQHLLVDYIHQHEAFPNGVDYLYIYDDYPVAPSALAAFMARAMGLLPVRMMHPLAVFFVAAQCVIAYGTVLELLPFRRSNPVLGVLASLTVFLAYPYSVGVFADRFYSNMMMGDLIVSLSLWLAVVRKRLHPLIVSVVTVLLGIACLNSYPAWIPFVTVPFLALTLIDERLPVRARLAHTGSVVAVTGLAGIAALVDQWDFLTWFAPTRGRLFPSSLKAVGGPSLVLVALGAWYLARDWRRLSGFAWFLLLDIVIVAILYGAGLLDLVSLYIADKTFYFNIFVLAILTGLGLCAIRECLDIRWIVDNWLWCGILLALGLVLTLGVNGAHPSPSSYPITLDEYRVGYQVAAKGPEQELTYLVRHATSFYWLYGCVLGNTHDLPDRAEQWTTDPPTYQTWIGGKDQTKKALVSDVSALPQEGPWHIVLRSGNCAVIERTW